MPGPVLLPPALAADPEVLRARAERAAGTRIGDLRLTGARPVAGGDGEGGGVFRLAGRGVAAGRTRAVSLVVKVLAPSGSRPGDWNWWRREADLYAAGVPARLGGALRAPALLAVDDGPGGTRRLWLEDVADARPGPWSAARFGRLGAALARLGPPRPGSDLPSATAWLRGWVGAAEPVAADLEAAARDPCVAEVLPAGARRALAALWQAQEDVFAALDARETVFCHRDAFRANLLAAGRGRTVAVDWAFAGPGFAGEDLVALVGGTLARLEHPLSGAPALEAAALGGHARALRETGRDGAAESLRWTLAAGTALRYGLGTLRLVVPALADPDRMAALERLLRRPRREIAAAWRQLTLYAAGLARETLA